ncbi:hypothetical protein R3P38DRAFT_2766584 [Favolaschia claudopus]|uniref:Uncharacterized protein n=1 Tax=Favolaschia claudopus TaxID=2862362 RepID=A0AAW0D234_9AGAR
MATSSMFCSHQAEPVTVCFYSLKLDANDDDTQSLRLTPSRATIPRSWNSRPYPVRHLAAQVRRHPLNTSAYNSAFAIDNLLGTLQTSASLSPHRWRTTNVLSKSIRHDCGGRLNFHTPLTYHPLATSSSPLSTTSTPSSPPSPPSIDIPVAAVLLKATSLCHLLPFKSPDLLALSSPVNSVSMRTHAPPQVTPLSSTVSHPPLPSPTASPAPRHLTTSHAPIPLPTHPLVLLPPVSHRQMGCLIECTATPNNAPSTSRSRYRDAATRPIGLTTISLITKRKYELQMAALPQPTKKKPSEPSQAMTNVPPL